MTEIKPSTHWDRLFRTCPVCGAENVPYPLITRHGRCNACRLVLTKLNGLTACRVFCGDRFVYQKNKGNIYCLVQIPCECCQDPTPSNE